MTQSKFVGMLRLFRFELPFAAGVCVILGELLALGALPPLREIILGFLSVFFISAAALILNDALDVEIDKVNAPERPIPSGLVSVQEVILLASIVTGLGFITSLMLGPLALVTAVVVWFVGFLYNWRFKKTGLPGNLMVNFSVGMTLVFGGIAVGQPFEKVVWAFAVMVFLISLGEEIAGDAMDVEGDRQAGSRSLAVVLGREQALRVSAASFLLVIAASFVPFVFGWVGWIYFIPLALMDAAIVYGVSKLLDARIPNRGVYIRWIYMSGLGAILIFIVMKLVGG